MSLFMETTKIGPAQTVGEIQRLLGAYGATAILTEYENNEVSALSFRVRTESGEIPFRLPCRWEAIFKVLEQRRTSRTRTPREEDEKQAKRVAWRQILRWIEAQMALVQTRMVKVEEVFLPYMQARGGKTLYEIVQASGFKMLEGPKE